MRKIVLMKSTTVTKATNDNKLLLHFCGSSPRFVDFASGSRKGTDCTSRARRARHVILAIFALLLPIRSDEIHLMFAPKIKYAPLL
jgi:hypothetical protein